MAQPGMEDWYVFAADADHAVPSEIDMQHWLENAGLGPWTCFRNIELETTFDGRDEGRQPQEPGPWARPVPACHL